MILEFDCSYLFRLKSLVRFDQDRNTIDMSKIDVKNLEVNAPNLQLSKMERRLEQKTSFNLYIGV